MTTFSLYPPNILRLVEVSKERDTNEFGGNSMCFILYLTDFLAVTNFLHHSQTFNLAKV